MSKPRSLCVLRLSAIGDVCHTVPVVRTLQAAFPTVPLTWVIGRTEATLVGDLDGVEFITFDKRSGLRGMRALGRELAGRRFDVVLQMQVAIRASILGAFIPAGRRLGFDRARAHDFQWLFTNERIAAGGRQHVMDALFGFAEALGVHERLLRWDIPVAADDEAFARGLVSDDTSALVISPCSSQRTRNFRNWRVERYAAVADHAWRRHRMRVLVTGGPTQLEREYGAALVAACPHATDLTGRTTLKQLYALLRRARALVGPDSGPVHMATAAGTPVIGLYATSNPARTGPYFSSEWTVDRYADALARERGTTPDEVEWGGRVRSPDAMDLITVDEVTVRLDRLMET
ncbi:MAG: glycosyltransferase family 9 protein [Xanthomonadaceae bacterium]|nr:glycosyltransferase family 9 protein [Xanthomonadaceae bacterium]